MTTATTTGGWRIADHGRAGFVVTSPDGTQYEVAAHLEYASSPIPESDVVIDRITSKGAVLHDGRQILAPFDSQVTELAVDAVLTAAGY
jgi:hypothetical protein